MSRKCVVKFVVKVVLLHKGPPTFNTLKTEGPHGNCGVATQSVWWDKRCRLALQGTVHHLRRRARCLWISTRCANQCFRFHWFGSLWECASSTSSTALRWHGSRRGEMPSAGESRRAVLKSWLFCTQWIKNTGQNGIGTCAPWEKGTAQLDHRRNSHVELDGLWPAEFDRSEAVGATCAILNVVPLTPERPMCPRERRGTVEWPAEKPCPKPKAACSGQACRQRGRSSIMRNVCRIPTAVRMPAEGSPNSLSAPRSILRHASWPAMPGRPSLSTAV
jgi:hypothetical protein